MLSESNEFLAKLLSANYFSLRLSFKVWMCGGRIEYIPCSNVWHMSKKHIYGVRKQIIIIDFANLKILFNTIKHKANGKGGYRWNTDRIAEIWLDDYKRYYYRLVGDTKKRQYGNITDRVAIKKKLGCKPFQWYIDNIYPNVPIPDAIKDPVTVPV